MKRKWRWLPRAILAMIILILALAISILFIPYGGHAPGFGMLFPAWLILMTLLAVVLVLFGIIEGD